MISDETLNAAGLNEREAKVEIACLWFDEGKLTIGHAANLAGLTELEFEKALDDRGLPRFRITQDKLDNDIDTLTKLGKM